jgi:hypothetical protein
VAFYVPLLEYPLNEEIIALGDCVRTRVVSHLNAEATPLAVGGIYFRIERSRNVNMIAGLLFKCNSAG